MAKNPNNFAPVGNFLYGLLHPGQLTPAQLGWMVFFTLALLNIVVVNIPLDLQIQYYRWLYSPILAVAFTAAKKPFPASTDATSGPATTTDATSEKKPIDTV